MDYLDEHLISKIADKLPIKDIEHFELCNKNLNNLLKRKFVNEKCVSKKVGNLPFAEMISYVTPSMLYDLVENENEYAVLLRENHKRYKTNKHIWFNLEFAFEKYNWKRLKTYGLTSEQLKIINHQFTQGETVLVQAFAGTGKTTTLYNVAKENQRKSIYLAFNKELCKEAQEKFKDCPWVTVKTFHSLAYNESLTLGKFSTKSIIDKYQCSYMEANVVKKILNSYFASADKHISEIHADKYTEDNNMIILAKTVFNDMKKKEFQCSHDGYLKLYQLSKPTLDYEFIYLDECQDVTPAILNIIFRQKSANKILVGDVHQQIYQFRNVCNVFKVLTEYTLYTLSVSFRYGYSVAKLSNLFLNCYKKENKEISSNCNNETRLLISPSIKNLTYICRTNFNALTKAFEYDKKVWILGSEYKCEKEALYIRNLDELNNGNIVSSKFEGHTLHTFTMQCIMYNISKWLLRLKIYHTYGVNASNLWLQLYSKLDKQNYDLLISTVHKSKGLEFDNVWLSNDFTHIISRNNKPIINLSKKYEENYNLIYVAITRAKKNLVLNHTLIQFLSYLHGDRFHIEDHEYKHCENCNMLCNNTITHFDGSYMLGLDSKIVYTYFCKQCYNI